MIADPMLERRLSRHPRVAIRREPFGALAYHYDTRRLVFLRHPDLVAVVAALDGEATVADALRACAVERRRWPSFTAALTALHESEMLREHDRRPACAG